jgi:hypothetical protein
VAADPSAADDEDGVRRASRCWRRGSWLAEEPADAAAPEPLEDVGDVHAEAFEHTAVTFGVDGVGQVEVGFVSLAVLAVRAEQVDDLARVDVHERS